MRLVGAATFLIVVLATGRAGAVGDVTVYDNSQSVPVGGRAAGMAGAYTALACDEGALHYNPASLSCAASSHLELSANAYVLQGMRKDDGPITDIFSGVMPFMAVYILALLILMWLPDIALWLPRVMR